MKIFTSAQIRELDSYTVKHEPIASIDLMERAAKALAHAIADEWDTNSPMVVFAGPGNNGGDALAVARLLAEQGYSVSAYLFNITSHLSVDCEQNRKRMEENRRIKDFVVVTQEFDPPVLTAETVVIDGLFGSGLNKPLAGGFASLVKYINNSPAKVVSIDVPSGLMAEDNSFNVRAHIIRATLTLTLQHIKLSFLFAENQQFIGRLKILDIRINKEGIDRTDTQYILAEEKTVRPLLQPRNPFAHKGEMGHALLIAGSYGMGGAAILAAKACLRAGAGKVTVHAPRGNNLIMQVAVPEAVVQLDREETAFSEPVDTEDYDALAIGPGLGMSEGAAIAMIAQLRRSQCPIVADADALNLLANHRAWMQQLPQGMIMTPHPKEFDRMAGRCTDSFERLAKAVDMAKRQQIYIILKGHHSALCLPDGHVLFNSTGNAGMATAGSGDVLTGIITALLAKGHPQADACLLGMYLHGLAGDLAAKELGEESLVASDIIAFLPKAFKALND